MKTEKKKKTYLTNKILRLKEKLFSTEEEEEDVKKILSEKNADVVDLYYEYFYLLARHQFNVDHRETRKLMYYILVTEHLKKNCSEGVGDRRSDLLFKKKVFQSVVFNEILELSKKTTSDDHEENIYFPLFKKIVDHSWLGDDDEVIMEQLKKGWTVEQEEKMKNLVIRKLKENAEKYHIPSFQRESEKKISKYLSSSGILFQDDNNFKKEIRILLENEFLDVIRYDLLSEDKMNVFLKKRIENSYVCGKDVILQSPENTKNEQIKFLGFRWKSNDDSMLMGYGIFYKRFSSGGGGFFNRLVNIQPRKKPKMYRPVYYGKFLISNQREQDVDVMCMKKYGDGCKEFKDGIVVYEGSFNRNGVREGKGIEYMILPNTYHQESMRVFEGRYRNGKRDGRGEFQDPETGDVKRGRWKDGELLENSVYKFSCPIIGYNEIEGYLKDSKAVGRGANGVVYEVKASAFSFLKKNDEFKKSSTQMVAVKIMRTKSGFEKELCDRLIKRGIGLCYSINSKHILQSYGIIKGITEVGYVMELCEKSIDDVIGSSSSEQVSLKEKIRIIKETALGMKALHSRNVMHRDLKWGNVMRSFDGVTKLTDFDTLKEDEVQWRLHSFSQSLNVGTPGFRPPEVCIGKKYTLKCDVYAFGLMIYALLWEEKFPYITQFQCSCGAKMTELLRYNKLEEHVSFCNLRPLLYPEEMKRFPSFLIDLMIQCWSKNPFNRPSFEEIVFRFDLEEKKQFSKITLQFPSHPEVADQKMYLTKPFGREKIIKWIEQKFNSDKLNKNKDGKYNYINDSSSINYLDDEDEENQQQNDDGEEEEGEMDEEEQENDELTKVLVLEHAVRGTIHDDEDVVKVIENDQTPTFQARLSYVNESFVLNSGGGEGRRIISIKKLSKMEKKNELLVEENKVLRRRDVENKSKLRNQMIENRNLKTELEKLKSFLKKRHGDVLEEFLHAKIEDKVDVGEETEVEEVNLSLDLNN